MAETRRRRGWRLSFVFIFLFSFFTTTCLIDRERSVGVSAQRSNWQVWSVEAYMSFGVVSRLCELQAVVVYIVFTSSFAKLLRFGWGSVDAVCGVRLEVSGSFLLKLFEGWSFPRGVETFVAARSNWRRVGRQMTTDGRKLRLSIRLRSAKLKVLLGWFSSIRSCKGQFDKTKLAECGASGVSKSNWPRKEELEESFEEYILSNWP
jgi:hypothetical protein